MRALITGASGFVGPHLDRLLTSAGDEVTGLDQRQGPDLLDAERWVEVLLHHQPDVVYHLAGWSDVSGSSLRRLGKLAPNVALRSSPPLDPPGIAASKLPDSCLRLRALSRSCVNTAFSAIRYSHV